MVSALTGQQATDRSYAARMATLQEILDHAVECRIDDHQLARVASVLADLPAEHVAERTYSSINLRPADFPDQTLPANDLDAIQYNYVAGSQGFFIWERDAAGHATPWEVTVNGRRYRGAGGLFACHIRALERGLDILDPSILAGLTASDLAEYYRDEATGQTTLQHLEGRLAKYREIGTVLRRRFDGHFANLLAEAEGWLFREDGRGIIQLLDEHFPISYGDWPFAKLAMVMTRGLHQRRDAAVAMTTEFERLTGFHDTNRFDCGADYYRPFFLMRVGVLRISDRLREQLAAEEMIEAESAVEHEYRAATILACDRLAEQSHTPLFNAGAESWETAFQRCRRCVPGIAETELRCPYARVCHAYNHDSELLRIRWPLTYTLRH
jgi:Potential Queuosine, Q, salvage protein family